MLEEFPKFCIQARIHADQSTQTKPLNASSPNRQGLVRLEPSARQFGLKCQVVFGSAARKDLHAQ
jgi:hypothetical protein